MRKLFAIMVAAALGVGASDANANSINLVATGSTNIVEGTATTFDVVVTFTQALTAATFQVDVVGLGITSARNNLTGTLLGDSNFNLRQMNFAAFPGSVCAGTTDRTCTVAAPGAPSAGNLGGLAAAVSAIGTFTIGQFTVVGGTPGDSTASVRITQPWLDGGFNAVANPTSNVLHINVTPIPEPGTAALIGLGLAGLVAVGRRNRA
jgi:hypothetical protein